MKESVESRVWSIEVLLEENEDETRAQAILDLRDDRFVGWGRARRNPEDPAVARIGEELASARALSGLAQKLLEVAANEIESHEGRPVHVHP